ncbi:MAG: hypothetical protein FJW39_01630 [Acidobacteria bacterium]|nr:hypothetical protein [Acidobacteriota bacterium]
MPLYFGEPSNRRFVTAGLDLGHANDYSALAVIERGQVKWILRQALRFPLGTSFGNITDRLRAMASAPDMRGRTTLIVDSTGLGAPVVEMLRAARIPVNMIPVVLTGGQTASYGNGVHHVPKRDLISALYLMFDQGQLMIPRSLPNYRDLREELLHFHANISGRGHTSYGSSREPCTTTSSSPSRSPPGMSAQRQRGARAATAP